MTNPRPGQHWQDIRNCTVVVIVTAFPNLIIKVDDEDGPPAFEVNLKPFLINYRQMTTREIAAWNLFGIDDIGTVSDEEDAAIDRRMREDAQSE